VTTEAGEVASTMKYFPFGDCRNSTGALATDRLFTGQRRDSTGLYYYGARYYDPTIGRFISADTIVPDPFNPQSLNRYSYCLNNPLKYIDPTGHFLVEQFEPDPEEIVDPPFWDTYFFIAAIITSDNKITKFDDVTYIWISEKLDGSACLGGKLPFGLEAPTFVLISEYVKGNLAWTAIILSHELTHKEQGRFSNSVMEEVQAYQNEYKEASCFGIFDYHAEQFKDTDLSLSGKDLETELKEAKVTMERFGGSAGSMYRSLETTPPPPDSIQEKESIQNMINGWSRGFIQEVINQFIK
jgi:RHS repeat-associated protein